MTANQRRPGFRLPWGSEENSAVEAAEAAVRAAPSEAPSDAPPAPEAPAAPDVPAAAGIATPAAEANPAETPATDTSATDRRAAAEPVAPEFSRTASEQAAGAVDAASPDFMRDLVSAMRGVAGEARQAGITEARTAAEEQIQRLEADAERRRDELRSRAEADVAGIGEWAGAEAERIQAEAEQRVIARRNQLDQQLSAETARVEADGKALRDRVSDYERELDAYHAQLAEINDPAAFAAAAKRMPRPPVLEPRQSPPPLPESAPAPSSETATEATEPVSTAGTERSPATNGRTPAAADVHPAEEEVLAGRLAELDARLAQEPVAAAPSGEPTTTEIVVSGLGSFGAITGFRQALSGVDGIDGVALSLGQTGEFIFRATHATGFDVSTAITALEGDGATIAARPDGGLHVTLDRSR
jgi:hypothetical protein